MAPRKQGQTTLTRERIVEGAVALVDAEGLASLSMRRLGAVLDVDAKTIYYHIRNKAALEELVVDAVMQDVDLSADDPSAPSIERLMHVVHALAAALLAHRHALPLFASRTLTTPASLRPIEHLLGVLHEAGLDYPAAVAAVNAVVFYVLGACNVYAGLDQRAQDEGLDAMAELPVQEFPHLTAAAEQGLMDKATEFDMGARALLTGLLGRTSLDPRGSEPTEREGSS